MTAAPPPPRELIWRRYVGGMVLGAFVGARAVAGVTGPHPNGRYAATWSIIPPGEPRERFFVDEASACAYVRETWQARRCTDAPM